MLIIDTNSLGDEHWRERSSFRKTDVRFDFLAREVAKTFERDPVHDSLSWNILQPI